ncbi:hypothetical protein TIFTF001_003707 [Ficus carica]|uniref:RING-type E3 ubiquitin transferase n=1 Tax=Ficus carica TaxID=3494 RepID=A0AA87ZCU5_FICCA|nr:hypothetical protein TIFTF001_003707 [Ficus carica]
MMPEIDIEINLQTHLENNISLQFSWDSENLAVNIEDRNVASIIIDVRNDNGSIYCEISADDYLDQLMDVIEPLIFDVNLSEAALTLKPATEPSVEALEKMTYEEYCRSSCDDPSELTCAICMEVVVIDSHLTRMPCSHLFHSGCILSWLNTSHTCPICRFELPC